MDRHDRLSCELAIWADVVLESGLLAFASQRSNELRLRPPGELARRWGIPDWAMKRACAGLRKEGVLSDLMSHLDRYIVLKPAAFLRGLSLRLSRRLGQAVLLNLPPALRGQSPEKIIEAISHALKSADEGAVAILHTALAVEASWLARAKVYSGPGPVALALSGDDLRDAAAALNLTRLKARSRERSKDNPLGLPDGFAYADLLVFSRRPDVKLRIDVGPWAHPAPDRPIVRPVNPVANALLLSLFPLRGEEAAERLVEILHENLKAREEGLYVGPADRHP